MSGRVTSPGGATDAAGSNALKPHAKPRRRRGVMARRDAGNAQGESWFALCPANATTEPNPCSRNLALRR